jgi:hypothetical protein
VDIIFRSEVNGISAMRVKRRSRPAAALRHRRALEDYDQVRTRDAQHPRVAHAAGGAAGRIRVIASTP